MEVTDWEYYAESYSEGRRVVNRKGDRNPVRVNPFNPATPRRTVEKSAASVRLFEAFDYSGKRVLLKEFLSSGRTASSVARAEAETLAALGESWQLRCAAGQRTQATRQQEEREEEEEEEEGRNPSANNGGGGGSSGWLSTTAGGAMAAAAAQGGSSSSNPTARAFALAGESNEQNVVKVDTSVTPFVTLLGAIDGTGTDVFASKDFTKKWRRSFPEVQPPLPRNVWLVFKWEGFGNTVARWPSVPQQFQPMDSLMPRLRSERRSRFVKAVMKSSLEALAFLHESGFVHRSLGPGSLLLSSEDERDPPKIIRVKLTDLGFSTRLSDAAADPKLRARFLEASSSSSSPASSTSSSRAAGKQQLGSMSSFSALSSFATGEDLHVLGLVFLELVFAGLSTRGGGSGNPQGASSNRRGGSGLAAADMETFRRLYNDVFEKDLTRLRDFCAEEALWEEAVLILDERTDGNGKRRVQTGDPTESEESLGDGWLLLGLLLGATSGSAGFGAGSGLSARELLASPFLIQR